MEFQFEDIDAIVVIGPQHTLVKTREPESVVKSYAHEMACRFQRGEKIDLFIGVIDLRPQYLAYGDAGVPMPVVGGPNDVSDQDGFLVYRPSQADRKARDEECEAYSQHMADLLNRGYGLPGDWCENVGLDHEQYILGRCDMPAAEPEQPKARLDFGVSKAAKKIQEGGGAIRNLVNRCVRGKSEAREQQILAGIEVWVTRAPLPPQEFVFSETGVWHRSLNRWVEARHFTPSHAAEMGFVPLNDENKRGVVEHLSHWINQDPENRAPKPELYDQGIIDEADEWRGPVKFHSNQDLARNGAVAIECKHGYDCCPVCDADDS